MIIEPIKNRRSTRDFKDEAVSEEEISEVIKAGQFAPSSRNNRAIEYVVVRDKATKDKIGEAVSQPFVKAAPVLIIPVTDPAKSLEAMQDLSVASENIFLQAEALGLGTVWKNVSPETMQEVAPIIGVPKNLLFINIIPLGRPKTKLPPHTDAEFDPKKIHQERW